jgi:hypothetical protein
MERRYVLAILVLFSAILVSGCVQQPQSGGVKTIGASIESNCVGFVVGGPGETALVSQIGGAWARPHPGPFAWGFIEKSRGNFDFSATDNWVREAGSNGVALVATIWPYADWDQVACRSSACEVSAADTFYPQSKGGFMDGIPKSRCAPCDMAAYDSFLSRLVERYDGDGVDDMPGLQVPVKYWEVLNEPEMQSDGLTFFKGTKQEYVSILKASYETVKAACADCSVVQAGAAGTEAWMLAYWNGVLDLGAAQYFDVANIHYIRHGDLSTLNVRAFKELLAGKGINKPLWATEAEYDSESQIEGSVTGALAAGAEKVFFTQFKIGQFGQPAPGQYSAAYDAVAAKCGQS